MGVYVAWGTRQESFGDLRRVLGTCEEYCGMALNLAIAWRYDDVVAMTFYRLLW